MRKRAVTAPLSAVSCVQHLGVVVQPAQQAARSGGISRVRISSLAPSRASMAASSVVDALARQRRDQHGRAVAAAMAALRLEARRRVEPVDLVPDLQDRRIGGLRVDAEIRQHALDIARAAPRVSAMAMSRTCRTRSASTTSSSVARKAATSWSAGRR